MKQLLFCGLLLLVTASLDAQVRLGFRGGISTPDLEGEDFRIFDQDGVERLGLALTDANYGVHAGLVFRIYMGRVLLQPEVLLNSNRIDYRLTNVNEPDSIQVFNEKYQYLDIPIQLGVKFGILRLMGGPVAHVYLSSSSGIENLESLEQDFNDLTLGYQAGVGLDLWKFTVDLRYEGNFNNAGEHFNFFGQQYQFSQSPARFLFSVGFMFGEQP